MMMISKLYNTTLLLVFVLEVCSSLPVLPDKNIFRVFYEKPSINGIQGKLIQLTKPQPVVDTLTEAEKCCNTQQHIPGRKLVGAYESIASVLASVSQVPKQTKDNIGGKITVALNHVGGKIVGLEK